jgi:hypothetical protein
MEYECESTHLLSFSILEICQLKEVVGRTRFELVATALSMRYQSVIPFRRTIQ